MEIHFHPPRSPDAAARIWNLKVIANSKAHGTDVANQPMQLSIDPYVETTTKVRPERVKGRRKADFGVAVENKANAPIVVALEGQDPDSELQFGFDTPPQQVAPGETMTSVMRVKPGKQIWLGRAQEKRFEVTTLSGPEAEERLAEQPVSTEEANAAAAGQRGRRWRIPGISSPHMYRPQVYQPNVSLGPGGINISKPQFRGPQLQAPQMQQQNVNLGQLANRRGGGGGPAAPAMPLMPSQGIFRQKAWLPWWMVPVVILLAALLAFLLLLMPKNVVVPKLVGMTATEASDALVRARLDQATDRRVPSARRPGTVLAQVPDAGTKLHERERVRLTVSVGHTTRDVPKVVGLRLPAAQRALNQRGFELGRVEPFDADPHLRVRFQSPAPGRRWRIGTPVDLALGADATRPKRAITAGPDEGTQPKHDGAESPDPSEVALSAPIAFGDSRGRVLVARRAGSGRPVVSRNAGQPTWHPDGRLAYLTGPDPAHVAVVLTSLDGHDAPSVITDQGPYHRPAFSPDGHVLVVVRAEDERGAGVLCFEAVPDGGPVPDCQSPDPEWQFGRPAWSPRGDQILALARRRGSSVYTRIVVFETTSEHAAAAESWTAVDLPLRERPYIQFAAWSADGIAVLEGPSPGTAAQLDVFSPDIEAGLTRARDVPTITGCQLAWAPDGRIAVAERGCLAQDLDGPIRLIDPADPSTPPIELTRGGVDPAWPQRAAERDESGP